jgi:hypothetical protein
MWENEYMIQKREKRKPAKSPFMIVWPNGLVQEKLEPKSQGLTWQHLHHGHTSFYQECYACVCEEAY